MGLIEYAAMQRQWADHPPTHILLAAQMGVKPRPRLRASAPPQTGDLAELAAMFGAAPGKTSVIR